MKRAVAALLLPLLPLASWTPVMCGQCLTASPNQDASKSRSFARQQTSQTATTGAHCQRMADSQWGSSSHVVSAAPCHDNPCRQSLNPASELNRSAPTQLSGVRFAIAGEILGDDSYSSKDTLRSSEQRSRLKPSWHPSLFLSLRI